MIEKPKLQLEESVLIVSILSRLNFSEYKLLSEWLGVYQYTSPKDRELNWELLSELSKILILRDTRNIRAAKKSSSLYFNLWNYSTWIEQFTLESQQRILKWIRELRS